MTLGGFADLLKNLAGLVGAVLAWLESLAQLLPINPVIRADLLGVSSLLAVVCGFVGYQHARRTLSSAAGKLTLLVAFLALAIMIAGSIDALNALPPKSVSLLVRASYVAFFAAIGGTIGAFAA